MLRRGLILVFLPLAAFADDPFACVDPDVVDAFVGQWYDSAEYSTALPADAPGLALPAEFELIGSMTAGPETQVVYKSEQESGAALASGIAALEAGGWKDRTADRGFFRGFRSASLPRFAHLCRESEARSLDIQTKERPGDTLLLLSFRQLEDWRMCRAQAGVSLHPSLHDYIPILEVPNGAELHDNGSGGGGDEYSAHATISTTASPDDLLRHFSDQVRTQGWAADSEWSGGTTAGTVWTRRGANDQLLVGTMRIAEGAEGVFNARFTVISVAPEDRSPGRFSSSPTLN